MYRYKQSHQVAQFLCIYICLTVFSMPLWQQEQSIVMNMIDEGAFTSCITKTTDALHKNYEVRQAFDETMVSGNLIQTAPRSYDVHFKLPLKIKIIFPF